MSMVAILIDWRTKTICTNFQLTEGSRRNLNKTGPGGSQKKLLKDMHGRRMDGWTMDEE